MEAARRSKTFANDIAYSTHESSQASTGASAEAEATSAMMTRLGQRADTVESLAIGSLGVGVIVDSVRDIANETGEVVRVVFDEAKSVHEISKSRKREIAKSLISARAA